MGRGPRFVESQSSFVSDALEISLLAICILVSVLLIPTVVSNGWTRKQLLILGALRGVIGAGVGYFASESGLSSWLVYGANAYAMLALVDSGVSLTKKLK